GSLALLAEKMQLHAGRLIRDVHEGKISPDVALPEATEKVARQRLRPNPARARELEGLLERHGALSPKEAWRNGTLMSGWKGGTMPLYLEPLRRTWGEVPVRDFGYMASEGRGSIPLVDAGAAGALAVTSHFFEFIQSDEIDADRPTCLTVDQLV